MKYANNKIFYAAYVCLFLAISSSQGIEGLWLFLFSVIVGAVVLLYHPVTQEGPRISRYFLILPIALFFASRLLPFAMYGEHPLGYDTGFYKQRISQERERQKADSGLFFFGKPTGSETATRILIALGLNDNGILYWFYILVGFLIGVMVYVLSKLYFGESAAFFSGMVYSVSFVQFLFYWNFFWKNSVALFFALLAFYLIERNRRHGYMASIPCIFFVFVTHRTTSFVLFITLAVYVLLKKNIRAARFFLLVCFMVGLVVWYERGAAVLLWQQILLVLATQHDFFSLKEGIFIDSKQFLGGTHAFMYLPFGILTAIDLIQKRKINLTLVFGMVAATLVVVQFLFYKRIVVFFDLALIIFFGHSFRVFFEKISVRSLTNRCLFPFAFFVFFVTIFFLSVVDQQPLVYRDEMRKIEQLQKIEPGLRVFTDNSYYTPWLYGFSGHKIIAPGWGDAPWTREIWERYWAAEGEEKKRMLADFNPPFILYNPGGDLFWDSTDSCFMRIEGVDMFTCR